MDFSLILFVLLVVTGVISLAYHLFASKREVVGVGQGMDASGIDGEAREPIIVEYAKALFPVILIVFVLRSFIVEPFRIPSGSMLPTLHIGDFILVNKFNYGIRLPVVNKKVMDINLPERGDVMVFRFPRNLKQNFIKRVIGLPGDKVSYFNKKLSINGIPAEVEDDGVYAFKQLSLRGREADQFVETFDQSSHTILLDNRVQRSEDKTPLEITVPEGHYFVMGDNRDHSNDSRYWRFVPEENIVGKAFFIWFSWKGASGGGVNWGRIGLGID